MRKRAGSGSLETSERIHHVLDGFTALVVLNVLWLLASLGVVTTYAATTAVFSVLQSWDRTGGQPRLARAFMGAFRRHLRRATVLGLGWTAAGAVLAVDLLVMRRLPETGRLLVLPPIAGLAVAYLLTSIYLFPLLARHPDASARAVVGRAVRTAFRRLPTSLASLLVVAAAGALVVVVPTTICVVGAGTAAIVHALLRTSMDAGPSA